MTTDKLAIPLNEAPVTYNTLKTLIATPTVPARYRESQTGVADMYAATIYGKEMGIGPMTSIYMIYLVNGQASMLGQLMLALIWRAGHKIKVTSDETVATVYCWRRIDGELVEVGDTSFTIEDAVRADLVDKGTYEKYPRHMLTWRAVSMAARLYYPDVITGVGYVPDELGIQTEPEEIPDFVDQKGLELERGHMVMDAVMEAEVVNEA